MINGLTQFAEGGSGIGALGIDVRALVIQVITFILAFLVLQHWAFKPIVKMMDQRRKTIEQGVTLGEKMQKQEAEMEQKVADTLHDARKQADEILDQAEDQAKQTVQAAEDKARDKANAVMTQAEERIAQETARARKKLEGELVNLVSEATEAIIDEKVDAKKDAELIDRALKGRA